MKRKRSEIIQEKIPEPPKYILEEKFRRVVPYYHEYSTFAKERWYGKSLISVFSCDFKDKPSYYYENAIKNSLITVDGSSVSPEYIVRPNNVISHLIHRHEPPVLNTPIDVIFEDDKVLIVNKPPSIPVHPSGRYNHNSLVGILKHEKGVDHLSVINRLDRLTSGIVILAKSNQAASELHIAMEGGLLTKEYVCKVEGDFPSDIVSCDAPIKTVSFKLGLNMVAEDGKECFTKFEKLKFDGKFSYIRAMPVTGRTHQIRVHLQHLGFPIVNDPLYNNPKIWGDSGSLNFANGEITKIVEQLNGTEDEYEGTQTIIDEIHSCLDCLKTKDDPNIDSLYLCLHAYKYSGPDFVYESGFPDWARSVE